MRQRSLTHDANRGHHAGRSLAAALCCATALGAFFASTGLAAQPQLAGFDCAMERSVIKERLSLLFRAQRADGEIRFEGPDGPLAGYPLLAALSFDASGRGADTRFLNEARNAAWAYYSFVLAAADKDGDFLIETSGVKTVEDSQGAFEDPGYNALFALDMLSLSRICAQLNLPIDALFWYEGAITVAKRVIDATYDSNAGYFLPVSFERNRRENLIFALSALPAFFDRFLGDNMAASILKNYVLRNQYLVPEVPLHYLDWSGTGNHLDKHSPIHSLKALLLLSLLVRNGFNAEANKYGAAIEREVSSAAGAEAPGSGGAAGVYRDYFNCLIASSAYRALFPRYLDLDLFELLVGSQRFLEPKDLAACTESLKMIRRLLADAVDAGRFAPSELTPQDIQDLERSVRGVYWAVSAARDKWKAGKLFGASDRSVIPGFDLNRAANTLFDDVVKTLEKAQNAIFDARAREAGLSLTGTLLGEIGTPGQPVRFKLAVAAQKKPIAIHSILIHSKQSIDTLFASQTPKNIEPGGTGETFWYMLMPSSIRVPSFAPIDLAAEVRLSDDRKFRYHFHKGVYVVKPLTFTVSFPHGMTLDGGNVPVRVELKKQAPYGMVVNAEWFSPAGLTLKEGRSLEIFMPERLDTAGLDLNVLVPDPCRPGAFPFVLKLFGNGEDEGTLSSSFFKHYQWVFIGPFTGDKLSTEHPPEKRISLLDTFAGLKKTITWRELPGKAFADHGEIVLDRALPKGSTGYLYTVIKTAMDKTTSVTFSSRSPAMLIINGTTTARVDSPSVEATVRRPLVLRKGMNNVLIKVASSGSARLFFHIGDEEDLTSDEFSNNLWELVDGYQAFHDRSQKQFDESGDVHRLVTFTYKNPDAHSVSVIGSFNGWSPASTNMRRNSRGVWEISLHLPPGRYAYRFLVNNSMQVLDPRSTFQEPDGYGGKNSVLFIH